MVTQTYRRANDGTHDGKEEDGKRLRLGIPAKWNRHHLLTGEGEGGGEKGLVERRKIGVVIQREFYDFSFSFPHDNTLVLNHMQANAANASMRSCGN